MLHRLTPQEQLQAALGDFAARVRQVFLAAIASIRSQITLQAIIIRLERHDTEGVIRALGIGPVAFNPVLDEIEAAYASGGGGIVRELPTLRDAEGFPISISFDARAPAAEAWLKRHGAELVRGIVDDQVTMLRNVLDRDVGQGMGARQIALDLVGRINAATGNREGGLIGLTASQEQWVANYQAALEANDRAALGYNLRDRRFDRMVRAAIDGDKPLTADQIGSIVRAYRNRALRFRGEAIGRTEALTALNAGREEAIRQMVASGAVSGNLVEQTWRTVMDGRERDSHAAMNGDKVAWGQAFVSGLGNRLRFPGDPEAPAEEIINCRCSVGYSIRKVA